MPSASQMIRDKELLVESLEKQIHHVLIDTPKNPLSVLTTKLIHRGFQQYSRDVREKTGKYVVQFDILIAYKEIEECQQIP